MTIREEAQNKIVENISTLKFYIETEEGKQDATMPLLVSAINMASERDLESFLNKPRRGKHYLMFEDDGYMVVKFH